MRLSTARNNPCLSRFRSLRPFAVLERRVTKIDVVRIACGRPNSTPNSLVAAYAAPSNIPSHGSSVPSEASWNDLDNLLTAPSKRIDVPAPLPPTPRAATLDAVLPYLAKLALGEGQLYWRVGAALVALFA